MSFPRIKRKGSRPRLRPALDLPGRETGYRRVLKFRRSWIAVIVLAAFDVVFLVPSITTFQQAVTEWSGINSLFDLVGAVFLTAWLMGWSIGPLLMTGILLLLLFGREVIMVRNGRLVIFVGIPVLGVEMEYSIPAMRNLRFNKPIKSSGKAWRGPHMLFDYGANMIAVGSQLSGDEMIDIKHHIQDASGQAIRRGEATEAELADHWEPAQKEAIKTSNRISPAPANMTHEPLSLSSPSTLALVFANLVPLAGATLLGWDLGLVMVLYWAESAVIGFINVCKIVVIGRWTALFAAPFFAGHFGGFMAVHFLFINILFVQRLQDNSGGDLAQVIAMFTDLWPALALLFISHALSFFSNFLGRGEYRNRTVQTQMSEPYRRIVFMHLVLIFGGGLTLVMGESTPVLMLAITVKIWIDVRAHLKQHV